jgi:IPT/TIG domain
MALFEGKTPSERNKLIAAMVLGVLALAALSYMFFGSSSTPQRTANNNNSRRPGTTQTTTTTTTVNTRAVPTPGQVRQDAELAPPLPINYQVTPPAVPEAGRNIFAFYEPPPKPSPTPPPPPSPSPPPPPSLLLSSISPTNVYARTGDFTLQVTGDKFTPAVRIYVGDAELATRFISPQQLSANVPAPLIGYEGARQVSVRTSDGKLFSNTATINVMAAPIPNYSFVGIIGDKRYSDTAILKDKNTKQLLNVQRGDIVGGRFRVTSISEREVWLTDTSIHIKHTLAFEGEGNRGTQPPYQPSAPQPRRAEEPEEGEETP